LDSAGGDYIWDFQVANEQYIIVANTRDSDGGRPRGIGVYNMQTGKRHSAWSNDPGGIFSVTEVESLNDCKTAGKNKEIILIYNRRALFGYSLHTGQRLWTVNIKNPSNMGIPHMSADGNYAFISYRPNGALSKSWCRLVMVDVYSGGKRDILQLNIEDNYEFAINPPSAYVNNDGDTLLYFTTDCGNFETNHGRGIAYCYNLTKKQMLWVNKELTITSDQGASAFNPPPFVIENDKLIITTRKAISCLNKNTGELIWQKDNLSFADRPPLYWEGKLYIRSGDPCILLCLDAQSGQQLWINTAINPIPTPYGRMAIYKDKLYFAAWGTNATHHLACVDIYTGQELWRDRGPYRRIHFDVLIDQKTGYLYCNTKWSTMCVDLNKTPKK
jgi:outer membrane protein assembly factor BamB